MSSNDKNISLNYFYPINGWQQSTLLYFQLFFRVPLRGEKTIFFQLFVFFPRQFVVQFSNKQPPPWQSLDPFRVTRNTTYELWSEYIKKNPKVKIKGRTKRKRKEKQKLVNRFYQFFGSSFKRLLIYLSFGWIEVFLQFSVFRFFFVFGFWLQPSPEAERLNNVFFFTFAANNFDDIFFCLLFLMNGNEWGGGGGRCRKMRKGMAKQKLILRLTKAKLRSLII